MTSIKTTTRLLFAVLLLLSVWSVNAQMYEPYILHEFPAYITNDRIVTMAFPIGDINNDGYQDFVVNVNGGHVFFGGEEEFTDMEWPVRRRSLFNAGDIDGNGIVDFWYWGGGREIEIYLDPTDVIEREPHVIIPPHGNTLALPVPGYSFSSEHDGLLTVNFGGPIPLLRFFDNLAERDTIPAWEFPREIDHVWRGGFSTGVGDLDGNGDPDVHVSLSFREENEDFSTTRNWVVMNIYSEERMIEILPWHLPQYLENSHISYLHIVKDLTGNGCDELFVSGWNYARNVTYCYKGHENFSISEAPDWYHLEDEPKIAEKIFNLGDLNGDGYDDLVLSTGVSYRTSKIFLGREGGWNRDPNAILNGHVYRGADFNGNGFNDFFVSRTTNDDWPPVRNSHVMCLSEEFSSSVSKQEGDPNLPKSFNILSIHPNPFNQTVNISFDVSAMLTLNVSIFNIDGRLVNYLSQNVLYGPGKYSLSWDGITSDGTFASSGLYIVKFASQQHNEVHKVTLIR